METIKKSIKADYLAAKPELKAFYQYNPHQPDFAQIIRDKARQPIDRQALHQALSRQYSGIPASQLTLDNIDALLRPNTYTLTTGHQLVLFGGPLYTIYKVMTVIRLAEQLNARMPEHHIVPVFWIHTEDHDFEEINHYYTSFTEKHTYQAPFQGKVGDHLLQPPIQDLIPRHFPPELKEAYQPGRSMREAYFRFMNELFKDYGLVILDADQPELKRSFSPILADELQRQSGMHKVEETTQKLTAQGYPAQISPREINLFYACGHLRNRIVKQNGHFRVLDSELSFSEAEMLRLAHEQPGCFSPNVCLRPLYQEAILPNLLYTGGWAEIAYWLQLKDLFDYHHINFPLLLPRMSATVFPAQQLAQWQALGFEPQDIHLPLHQLFKAYMPRVWKDDSFRQAASHLLGAYDALNAEVEQLSPTLTHSVKGQQVKTEKFIHNLEKKIHRVIRNKHPQPFEQIEELKTAIQADPLVQERVWSLAALELSPPAFVQAVHQACQPLNFEHTYIVLD
ncbi:MAG: bacillithiol biosynthesis cysteine-adding enzyme BshC [Bacteroidetes bacterium]|nr:MAG: bacillithiol biosynthesis cysteine-adding enzyme BshC [Bacteroidota bacterium]